MTIAAGGHASIGCEVNVRLDPDTFTQSNADLLRRTVEICDRQDPPVATLRQRRAIPALADAMPYT